jgi:hypothetical protein
MKSLILLAVAVLASSFVQLDTKSNNVQQNQPVITWVGTTMSFEPGVVGIRGQNFDLVTRVEINGVAVNVVRSTPTEIMIQPGSMDPGFAALALVRPGGERVKAAIEFTPSLRAQRFEGGLQAVVNPGEHGQIWLEWSLRPLATPLQLPGTYFPQLLDLTFPYSGTLCSEVSVAGEPVVVTAPFPPEGGMLDYVELRHAFYMQAWCLLGNEGYQCHTNMAIIPPVNIRPHRMGG